VRTSLVAHTRHIKWARPW